MIRLENEKSRIYQWSIDQRLIVDAPAGTEVHFSHTRSCNPNALPVKAYEEDGMVYADIPNILLQIAGHLTVYVFPFDGDHGFTEYRGTLLILPRKKPDNYVYTETEVLSWSALDKRIGELSEGSLPRPETAAAGQMLMVEEVDETGKVTKTAALDDLTMLIEADLLPATFNVDGKILTNEDGKILLRY